MEVTHELYLDLVKKDGVQRLAAKQGDNLSRNVRLHLRAGGVDWSIPEDASAVIRYTRMSDGASGIYDALPDDTPAYTIDGNSLTFVMAPQMIAAGGAVLVDVALVAEDRVLTTFNFWIDVERSPGGGTSPEGENYYRAASLEQINRWLSELEQGKVGVTGDEMQGDLDMAGFRLTGLPEPVDCSDAVSKEYVDRAVAGADQMEKALPEYWQSYLEEKIAAVRALQDQGGRDCFSFPVMTDMHVTSNLGKLTPVLAKKLMDACHMKYALCLGDVRRRGLCADRETVETEFALVEEMLSPIRDRLLQTQGNHDAGYGTGDCDGDAVDETYAFELTPAEMFERIYRNNTMAGDVHYDESGTAFYLDDPGNRVRYILLNTHCGDGSRNSSGTVRYPTMRYFRYTQSQYDFLTEDALATVPGAGWSVVIGSHVPINQTEEMPEGPVMLGVLNAYKNKTTYAGTFAGTASDSAEFTNLIDASSADYLDGFRYGNADTEPEAASDYFTTNYFPGAFNKTTPNILRITGLTREQLMSCTLALFDASGTIVTSAKAVSSNESDWTEETDGDGIGTGVWQWTIGTFGAYMSSSTYGTVTQVRFSIPKACESAVIITVNEQITYSDTGYDFVSVSADFSGAKGDLVGYFAGHSHADRNWTVSDVSIITTRCDAAEENDGTLLAERVAGTVTEQSFDVVTVNRKTRSISCTKIGAGDDRVIQY